MYKNLLVLLLSFLLLFSCSKNDIKEVISEPTDKEIAANLYAEGVQALKDGDAY